MVIDAATRSLNAKSLQEAGRAAKAIDRTVTGPGPAADASRPLRDPKAIKARLTYSTFWSVPTCEEVRNVARARTLRARLRVLPSREAAPMTCSHSYGPDAAAQTGSLLKQAQQTASACRKS